MENKIRDEHFKNKSWGLAASIDLHACNPDFIRDDKKIREFVVKLCKLIYVKRYGKPLIVDFGRRPEIAGYSMCQLIETSLVSGHFVNKTNNVYLDIFSCKYYDADKAVNFCKDFFGAKDCNFHYLLRK